MSLKSEFVRREIGIITSEIVSVADKLRQVEDGVFVIQRRMELLLHEVKALEALENDG